MPLSFFLSDSRSFYFDGHSFYLVLKNGECAILSPIPEMEGKWEWDYPDAL